MWTYHHHFPINQSSLYRALFAIPLLHLHQCSFLQGYNTLQRPRKSFKLQSELCRLEQQFTLRSAKSTFLANDTLCDISFSTILFLVQCFLWIVWKTHSVARGLGKTPPGAVLGRQDYSEIIRPLTLTFRSSAVVSSNCWPSLKEIVVFLKVLSVLMVTMSPFILMITSGFARPPSFRVAKPTPRNQKQNYNYILASKKLSILS